MKPKITHSCGLNDLGTQIKTYRDQDLVINTAHHKISRLTQLQKTGRRTQTLHIQYCHQTYQRCFHN